jgi:hypothetical protein
LGATGSRPWSRNRSNSTRGRIRGWRWPGDVVDRDPSKGDVTSATGHTGTAGLVFHVFD